MDIQIPLIWITAAAVLLFLVVSATSFVKIYQDRRESDTLVTIVCILALTSLLATVCLLPVDIALVSSTTNNATGLKREWATPETMRKIVIGLKVVYYILYSVDAGMCLLVVPFAYFWYEEWDVDTTTSERIKGALKYSVLFLALVVVLLLVGMFVPVAAGGGGKERPDLDWWKHLLLENHGERALTFIIGLMLCIGIFPFVFYTAPGLALTPLILIKSAPSSYSVSDTIPDSVQEALLLNSERQRIIDARSGSGMTPRDRRELDALQRERRTLERRHRIAGKPGGGPKLWRKISAVGRPIKVFMGILMLVLGVLIFVSMLFTSIDKAKNSVCGNHCGYIIGRINLFNPMNWVFVKASKVFPVDYVLALLLVLDLFIASVIGMVIVGIRFLWLSIFQIRTGHTKPQGMLAATVILMLTVLAINYAITMIITPQYASFGGQKFCNKTAEFIGHPLIRGCTHHKDFIIPCTSTSPTEICTPTVVSTFINRVTLNFPFFGVFAFWAQYAFLAVFIVTGLVGVVWTPSLAGSGGRSGRSEEEDAEVDEDEALLGSSGRPGGVRGLVAARGRGYGADWRRGGGDD